MATRNHFAAILFSSLIILVSQSFFVFDYFDNSNNETAILSDINTSFSGGSNVPYLINNIEPNGITTVGDTIYFSADDGSSGKELWAHDTSNASTWMVTDINNAGHSQPGLYMAILVGDTLYFSANDGGSGEELWAHDTSNSSTWQVADIRSGIGGSYPGLFMNILVGNTLYFSANNIPGGEELWAHDTSNTSTWMVTDFNGVGDSYPGLSMEILVGDTLYFDTDDGSSGEELWAHNISNATTWIVADINSVGSSRPGDSMNKLVGNTLYFSADDGNSGVELWAHDTSNDSTWIVADIDNSGDSYPGLHMEILVGDTLYFDANDGSRGEELWAHDTSNASTWIVADINNAGASIPGYGMAVLIDNTLYFSADDGINGEVFWGLNSGGATLSLSPASTTIVLTNNTAMTPSTFNWVDSSATTYYGNGSSWMVMDIKSGGDHSNPDFLTALDNTLYFSANNGFDGLELWKSDGTEAGTVMVLDINEDASSSPSEITAVGNTLFFKADGGTNGFELWKSDGTKSGTVIVKDIRSGVISSQPGELTALGNILYFTANNENNGTELWKSDGTEAGTVMVKDILPGIFSSNPTQLTAVGNTIFFTATNFVDGVELWKSNGTESGTVMVKDIRGGAAGSSPGYLTAVGNILYFTADNGINGTDLWKSDGTEAGTLMVKDINGSASNFPKGLTAIANTLFFTADDGNNGVELWKSDGTEAGTGMVKDINSTGNSHPQHLTAVGNILYFQATDEVNGEELWKSDGTETGTEMVKDINGSGSSSPISLEAVGNTLFFIADDGNNGLEWWRSNGTETGTVMVVDIDSGGSGAHTSLTVVGNTLYFRANDGSNGEELWAHDPAIITFELESIPVTTAICTILPSLPTGINLTQGTCEISGTPSVTQPSTHYTLWVNDTGVSNAVIVNITIQELLQQPPQISPTSTSVVLTRTVAMTPVVFSNSGGEIETWGVYPSPLPDGLEIASDGKISGIPTAVQIATEYTVWANNSGGSDSSTVTITINEFIPNPPLISYYSLTNVTQYLQMSLIVPTNIGGIADTWEISPELSLGLHFNTADGTISGIPTTVESTITYTIWANNTGGSDSATQLITVEITPEGLSISSPNLILVKNGAMQPWNFIFNGAHITSWNIHPDLPPELIFDGPSQSIFGTPTEIMSVTTFTLWANGSGISESINATIEILEDTDGDGMPDNLGNHTGTGLIEDLDDDADGIYDVDEFASIPVTESLLPDTDGDGICDGAINVTYDAESICIAGPDAFPDDPTEWVDTDGDNIGNNADLDDDGDQASDEIEIASGTDTLDPLNYPTDDSDSDGWTDAQEDFCGSDKFDAAIIPGDYDADLWCDLDDPDDDNDNWFDTAENDCGTDSLDETSFPIDIDGDGICDSPETKTLGEVDVIIPWWFCSLTLLVIIGILPLIMRVKDDAVNNTTRQE